MIALRTLFLLVSLLAGAFSFGAMDVFSKGYFFSGCALLTGAGIFFFGAAVLAILCRDPK